MKRQKTKNISKTTNNEFVIGNATHPEWIRGTIGGDRLWINDTIRAPYRISSKRFKKNIKPFKDFQKTLQDILKTPLFTFQLKDDPLKKDRMGVISEELPDHLQIKRKGKPSEPDWGSIDGTLWGAIKALHELFMEFKDRHPAKHKSLSQENKKQFMEFKKEYQEQHKSLSQENKKQFMEFKKEYQEQHKSLSQENKKLKKEIERLEGEIKENNKEIERLKDKSKY